MGTATRARAGGTAGGGASTSQADGAGRAPAGSAFRPWTQRRVLRVTHEVPQTSPLGFSSPSSSSSLGTGMSVQVDRRETVRREGVKGGAASCQDGYSSHVSYVGGWYSTEDVDAECQPQGVAEEP
jgi:hypothetical protein